METYTLTFGNRCENHAGMQVIGEKYDHGLSHDDLLQIQKTFEDEGYETELVNLNELLDDINNVDTDNIEIAELLVVRRGISKCVNVDDLFNEQKKLKKDTQAFMYGRV